ncbi:M48 family metalloprotease [Streptomyces sp. NPDC001100]
MPRRADPPTPDPEPDGSERDLPFAHRGRRTLLTRRWRGIDVTAVGHLLLLVPGLLMSLLVVLLLSLGLDWLVGVPFWIPPLLWLLSGALIFHRPTEYAMARYVWHMRPPMPAEAERLEPIWHEVTAPAGIDSHVHKLWVEESEDLNAYAAAGHLVGVTTTALDRLTDAELAGVLAHELGHHTWGHAWVLQLGQWYERPGRLASRLVRALVVFAVAYVGAYSLLAAGALLLVVAWIAYETVTFLYGVPLLLLATPYLIAAVGRVAELRADRQAAVLGFAGPLRDALLKMHAEDADLDRRALAGRSVSPGLLDRLLATHPDYATRLERLAPYLKPGR